MVAIAQGKVILPQLCSGQTQGEKIRRIYFDHAATTPLDPLVLEEMRPYFLEKYGNASSLHTFGTEAHVAMEEARRRVAAIVKATPEELIFTGSGTESDNLAIQGIAAHHRDCHIVTSAIEHPAVMNTCKHLEMLGHEVTYVPVTSEGVVSPEQVSSAMREGTRLVTIMHSNNEIGTIQPIEEIGKIAREAGAIFHTDATQSAGKVELDVGRLGVDLLSMSAHKLYGPKGVGALYVRKGVKLQPLTHGGGHEKGLRPSTENIPGIVGFGKAAELAAQRMDTDVTRIRQMRDKITDGTLGSIKEAYLNGHHMLRLPNLANFRFKYIEGESLLLHLDMVGIAASTGSACSSKSLKASHVLLALGLEHQDVHGSLRVSLGRGNTDEDADVFLRELPPIVEKLRRMSPLWK
jgi:cysteine desulfurase